MIGRDDSIGVSERVNDRGSSVNYVNDLLPFLLNSRISNTQDLSTFPNLRVLSTGRKKDSTKGMGVCDTIRNLRIKKK